MRTGCALHMSLTKHISETKTKLKRRVSTFNEIELDQGRRTKNTVRCSILCTILYLLIYRQNVLNLWRPSWMPPCANAPLRYLQPFDSGQESVVTWASKREEVPSPAEGRAPTLRRKVARKGEGGPTPVHIQFIHTI